MSRCSAGEKNVKAKRPGLHLAPLCICTVHLIRRASFRVITADTHPTSQPSSPAAAVCSFYLLCPSNELPACGLSPAGDPVLISERACRIALTKSNVFRTVFLGEDGTCHSFPFRTVFLGCILCSKQPCLGEGGGPRVLSKPRIEQTCKRRRGSGGSRKRKERIQSTS